MAQVTFDTVELENFVKRLGAAAQGDFKRALNKFLEGLGIEFLRITTVTALINWWYNNSFTQAAIEGDKTYENVKNQIH